jgi:ABC-type nitrate/sulfonate/bicarbonate transport system permease component
VRPIALTITAPKRTRLFWRISPLLGVVRQFAGFSLGSLLSRESLRVLIPLLLLWELLPFLGLVPVSLLPPPSSLVHTLKFLLLRMSLVQHLGTSLLRYLLGSLLAVLLAVPLGVVLGWNSLIGRHALPLFQILAPIPPPAWVPLAMIVLGVGLPMQVFLIFLGMFYPVLFNTYQGVRDTEPRYLASARVFGASEFTVMIWVLFWSALGPIVMGLRIGSSIGLIMLVVAEMFGGQSGVGYLLLQSKEYFQIDRMVVCMGILGGFGWFMNELLKFLEQKYAGWRFIY